MSNAESLNKLLEKIPGAILAGGGGFTLADENGGCNLVA
jgi:hypothetical protein